MCIFQMKKLKLQEVGDLLKVTQPIGKELGPHLMSL